MTDILTAISHRNAAFPAARIAARIAAALAMFRAATDRSLIALPEAVGSAAAMAYVDPFRPAWRAEGASPANKDHTDPRNF